MIITKIRRIGRGFGRALWVGFYVVQLAGATIWDNKPWQLNAVYAGDWLMKVLFMTIALSAYHRRVGAFKDDNKKQKQDG